MLFVPLLLIGVSGGSLYDLALGHGNDVRTLQIISASLFTNVATTFTIVGYSINNVRLTEET